MTPAAQTTPEPQRPAPGARQPAPAARRLLAFGTGVGIEIRGRNLEVAVTRVRPSRTWLLGRLSIPGFAERAAADWGAEYAAFLKKLGAGHLAATVLLPRREAIVRHVHLPGVAHKDLESAIAFQLDSLHPYGEDEIHHGWTALGAGAVLVAIASRPVVQRYVELLAEAGIRVASFTVSAAALHAALRIAAPPPAEGFLTIVRDEDGVREIYGESPARPVFSAELPAPRAIALGASELRLAEADAAPLETLLGAPEADLAYAAAVAAACPHLASGANLLPPEFRASGSRARLIPTLTLAGLLLLGVLAMVSYSAYADRQYLKRLEAEIAALDRVAQRAASIDREIDRARARTRLLDGFRGRTKDDLDALQEITRLLPAPVWTSAVEMTRDTVNLTGEADQAAGLVKLLDSSALFHSSEISLLTRIGASEQFRIRTLREARR